MIINILGSGTCIPSLERSSSSIWLRSENCQFLVDTGTGCIKRLLEAGGRLENIDAFILSHFHPDHCSEIVSILFSLKYGALLNKEKIFLMGGNKINEFYNKLYYAYDKWIDLGEKLEIIELELNTIEFGDIKIDAFRVNHRPESMALKFRDSKGKTFVFSGDMDMTLGFEEFCMNADLLVIESSFPDLKKKPGHLTPEEAALIAEKAGVKKLILTHLYPDADREAKKNNLLLNAEKIFNKEIIVAKDLMEIEL